MNSANHPKQHEVLLARIAAEAGISADAVVAACAAHGIPLPRLPDDQELANPSGKLLKAFLELPPVSALALIEAIMDLLRAEISRRQEQTTQAAEQRAAERARAERALAAAQERLDRLRRQGRGRSLTELAASAATLARHVTDAQEDYERLDRAFRTARRQRQTDEKLLNDTNEKGIARLLFHGLEPRACPRCDTPITEERRRAEQEGNRCAVCTTEIVPETADGPDAETAVRARLELSRSAEAAALANLATAESTLSRLTAELAAVQEEMRANDAGREQMAAELDVAHWRGALEMVSEPIEGEEA